MNAAEARRLTEHNLKGPVIDHWVQTLQRKIKTVAQAGGSTLDPWAYLATLRTPSPSYDEKCAISVHFQALGYKITEYNNPDPGHPCSRAYTTLTW